MVNAIIDKLNLKYSWEFRMFGSIPEDKELEDNLKSQMASGILPATVKYDALHDISILDDIAISDAIMDSDLLNRRIPLVNSYTMKQETSGLPPKAGRPESEGVTSDGQEQDSDANR
jgi:hypothetical protein